MENENNSRCYSVTVKKAVVAMSKYFERATEIEIKVINAFCERKHFGNFYKVFLNAAFLYFIEKNNLPLQDGFGNIIEQLYERIEKIPIRVLIEDINKQRVEGNLFGENTHDEYVYYQTAILGNTAYVTKLCEKYPVMKELMLYQIYLFIEYLCEIERAISRDKEIIIKKLCDNQIFQRVLDIQLNLSDSHRKGRTVAKAVLDNGYSIIYKPHGLKKELLFNDLCSLFEEKSDIKFKCLNVIDRTEYGWEEYIEAKECHTEEEVKKYYERMGVLLFFCYLLGMTDMHCENIIAYGEYPILIDLETMPGAILKYSVHTADECVSKKISNSVLRTGILPTTVWGNDGNGVILSALGDNSKMKTPFHLPYIEKPFTSEVHISYLKKDIDIKGSLPLFSGKEIGAVSYCNQICRGFETTYRLYMRLRTEMKEIIQSVLCQKGRFIIRHTQQYSMYLNIALYPQFLKSWESRYEFFKALKEHKQYSGLYQYEKTALQEMDIPIFEADIENGTVYDGEGKAYCLNNFTLDKDFYQMKHICENDLQYQMKCIEISLDMLTERRLPKLLYNEVGNNNTSTGTVVRNIADYLCTNALTFDSDISWDSIVCYDNQTWKLAPMELDLYDGLGGIAIFFASICRTYSDDKYRKIFELICKKLFIYTDGNGDSAQKYRTKNSGLFKGEGSIIYTYLILYNITGKRKFLTYAERHYAYFEQLFFQCETTDYLSGDAGAIIVLVKLYEKTDNKKYLHSAIALGEKLWKKARKQKYGYSIERDDGLLPLAGMAHGTSGYIMAYAYLLEKINETKYYERIEKLLLYENSLFDSKSCNWKDLRKKEQENQYTTAWCHGAPGIALARLKLIGIETFRRDKKINEDISNCLHLLQRNTSNDSVCLCHGLAGNYWIRNCLFESRDIDMEEVNKKKLDEIIERLGNPIGILPREKYNLSFMTGITGLGLLLENEKLCSNIFA